MSKDETAALNRICHLIRMDQYLLMTGEEKLLKLLDWLEHCDWDLWEDYEP
jgi:hypothetical protein